MKSLIKCDHCLKSFYRENAHINRSNKLGLKLFCSRECFGLNRRVEKSIEQKKEEKRIYDEEYRRKNKDKLRAKKAEYFQRTYDPEKAAVERKKNMHRHVEYCRRPEYRAKKKVYDRKYKAKLNYGPLWEHQVLIMQIFDEVNKHDRYRIKYDQGVLNKTQTRKREHEAINSEKLKRNPLADLKWR